MSPRLMRSGPFQKSEVVWISCKTAAFYIYAHLNDARYVAYLRFGLYAWKDGHPKNLSSKLLEFKMMRKNNTKVWRFISDYSSSPAPSKDEQQLELVLVFPGIQKCDGYSKAYDTRRVHTEKAFVFSQPRWNSKPRWKFTKITTTSSAEEAPAFCRSQRRSPTRQIHLTSCVPQSHGCIASRWLNVIERDKLKVI